MDQDAIYEERIVAFVDVLGFRNLIRNTETDHKLGRNVLWALNYIKEIRDKNRSGLYPECETVGRQITIFSDSIVVSYPTSSPSCLFYALTDMVDLQMNMFATGFPVRGGISLVSLYHQRDIVFGPALISAYDLESQSAIYPRIVIAENTVTIGTTKNPHNSPEQEKKYVLERLRKDDDGLYHVDFLNQRADTDNDEEYVLLLDKVREMIVTGLSSHNVSIQQKYEWLKIKYNATVIRQKLEAFVPLA